MERSLGRDYSEMLRDEMTQKDRIIELLSDGPMTIPEIAERLAVPSFEVVYWVMAMWRYGRLKESHEASDEGYFSYRLPDSVEE